ncbi:unnamed protein product [Lathyrus sativus]|nr:unnamed protein product [Lathyrus sativus]
MFGGGKKNPGKKNQGLGQKPSPVKKRASAPKKFTKNVDNRTHTKAGGFLQGSASIEGGATRIKRNLKTQINSWTGKPSIREIGDLPGLRTSGPGQTSQHGSFTRSGSSYGTIQSSYQTADKSYYQKTKEKYESSLRLGSTSETYYQSSHPPNDNSTVGSSSELASSKKSSKQEKGKNKDQPK